MNSEKLYEDVWTDHYKIAWCFQGFQIWSSASQVLENFIKSQKFSEFHDNKKVMVD